MQLIVKLSLLSLAMGYGLAYPAYRAPAAIAPEAAMAPAAIASPSYNAPAAADMSPAIAPSYYNAPSGAQMAPIASMGPNSFNAPSGAQIAPIASMGPSSFNAPSGADMSPLSQQQPQEAPKPISTGFSVDDGHNNRIHHNEETDANGHKKGSFGYTNEDGLFRTVNYIADDQGFRASILSNEPGLSAEGGAGVNINVKPVPAHIKAEMELLRIPKMPQVQPSAAMEHAHQPRMQDMNIMAQHQHPMAHHEMRPAQIVAPVASQGQYYGEPRMHHHADHPVSAPAGDIAY